MKNMICILFILLLGFACKNSNKKHSQYENIPASDRGCLDELDEAHKAIEEGKLIYCNYNLRLRCKDELINQLRKYRIGYKAEAPNDVIIEGRTDGCYCGYMKENIDKYFGEKFIDSLLYVADSIHISQHLDEIYDYKGWDKPPVFPGDTSEDDSNHSGLQAEFNKLAKYPKQYIYKPDRMSSAQVSIYLKINRYGKAKVDSSQFSFWNYRLQRNYTNQCVHKQFTRLFTRIIEQTKWTPAKIKNQSVNSENEIFLYLK